MSEPFSSNLGIKLRFASRPAALIGIVVIKAVLSLAVKPGSFLVSYSGISYFLLLLLSDWLRHSQRNTANTWEPSVLGVPGNYVRPMVAKPGS